MTTSGETGAPPPRARAPRLARNVLALAVVSFFTDVSSEMIYPLLPLFLTTVLGGSVSMLGAIEGAAETTSSLLKLASGWWSDRVRRRKPLVVVGYTLASFARPLVAFAASPAQVLAIRLTDRVGKGIRSSPRDALIADSVDPSMRGRAFGFHRAADHAGAVVGPLVAFALLQDGQVSLRTLFLFAALPGLVAVAVLALAVREVPRHLVVRSTAPRADQRVAGAGAESPPLGPRFWSVLGVILLFTLGNSTDAFLLLRATQLGVPMPLIPILWAMLHVVKSASSTPGGALSDAVGRKPLIVAGWLVYAAVYLAFGHATAAWQVWALVALYGVFFGLTEGSEKALVADLVAPARRGTAFGWYNLAIGLGALPASLLFGALWERHGPTAAFTVGAGLAVAASFGMALAAPSPRSSAPPIA